MPGKPRGGGDDSDPVVAGLKQVVQQVVNLQMEPTAGEHQQILQTLQQAIMGYLQKHQQQKAAQAAQAQQIAAQQAAQGQMMGGGPGGPPPGGPPAGQPGGPPSQGMPGLAMPNPDELRRVLGQAQGAAA